jgi:hypothetical protein
MVTLRCPRCQTELRLDDTLTVNFAWGEGLTIRISCWGCSWQQDCPAEPDQELERVIDLADRTLDAEIDAADAAKELAT